MAKLTPRKRLILKALVELGGSATNAELADATGLHPNGISQTLGTASEGDGWKLKRVYGDRGRDYHWVIETEPFVEF